MERRQQRGNKGQRIAELGAWIVGILLFATVSGLTSWFFFARERHTAGVVDLPPAGIPDQVLFEKFTVRSASGKSSVPDADRTRLEEPAEDREALPIR